MARGRRCLGLALLAFSLESFRDFSLPLPGRTGGQEPPEPNHENRFDVASELWYGADDMLTAGAFMGDEGWANRGESPATLGSVGISLRNAAEALLLADWYEPWLHVFCWTACGVLAPAKFTGRTGCHKQLDDAHRILPGGQLASLVGFMILDTRVCMLATTTSQDCSGELEVAGAAGDYYFLEEDFFAVAAALPGNAESEEDFDAWGLEQSAPMADAAVASLGRLSAEERGRDMTL
eukprot:s497_g4.t1